MVTMIAKEGARRDINFTVCAVSEAVGSVSHMRRTGHRVAFYPLGDPNGSYVQRIEVGERMWLVEQAGVYSPKSTIAPIRRQTESIMAKRKSGQQGCQNNEQSWNEPTWDMGFAWRAHP